MKVIYLPRTDDETGWADKPAYPRLGRTVAQSERDGFVIHHTVGADNDSTKNRWENLAEIRTKMRYLQTVRPDLGYDVPYSFPTFIMWENDEWSLVVCEGHGWDRYGAHTSGYNAKRWAFGFVGDFRYIRGIDKPVLDDAVRSLGAWARSASLANGYDPDPELGGHRDYKTKTTCPGSRLYDRLALFTEGYLNGDPLMTVSPEVLEVLENADPADLAFALGEAGVMRSIDARHTSQHHELLAFRAVCVWLGADPTDEAALPAAWEAKIKELANVS